MNRKEKNERKAILSKFVDVANCRLKDYELEKLEHLVHNRDSLNGTTKTYRKTYKAFDSKDTYQVVETDIYTFFSDENGIGIKRDLNSSWDDGQNDNLHMIYYTARDILKYISKVLR